MNLELSIPRKNKINTEIIISGSKSESNRLLILQQLFPSITIENLSDSDDTHHLQDALSKENNATEIADIGHAGTAMRFLTAFFATQEGVVKILQGSERMHNRPIKILVDALRDLDADIQYLDKEGYPPIKITGKKIEKDTVTIDGNVSSQYISALMLIAPSLKNGLTIELNGTITSVPYIKMTLSLLHKIGVVAIFEKNSIKINALETVSEQNIVVESDWSSASYFYSIIALSEIGASVTLSAYKKESLQGDNCLAKIYKHFGVTTIFKENTIVLTKHEKHSNAILSEDLKNAPDIAQTIAVTCFGLGIACDLTGLHTLKIKETDRLEALKNELTKLGANISVTNNSLHLKVANTINRNIKIATYNDHRMAMAFAPLALKTTLVILEAEVVSKSYRNFWQDMQQVGLEMIKEK
ncbi:3-phosphoshikimate 1-carboxyvinyltransferase [Tenacibaculum piscium]|uniref:3-phosphoshikimate 1-carboxyvinyltransferase n=1 Tax=Tenacibaculum piscium TaxID=1458515 RepID=A0A2H1YIL6_9FLAO|nr:3-phosphoshikimate 1-carboxyvinyltransferase [Tenacibaculum piscium]MBE7628566.1 3-phosphoshikimate 1-carboxyvinyltransferase [Tenacibaculum piscium]MBE7669707.1 3-phosphoshikimate 1-carboxyvinyltransferase [Tenacibaculum piscium]MBE7684705.1 3-phosphoshikimate 1-carboxyvinyltransferase [Tenacibaculum piscium]MBE7689325.1 3-phosphoshikimate 1-carboxyvinyltransferase [Tenacibaculum piscium]SOS75356.1 3-phosphoshikimate 1-carboxyvinyltransferase [Tenacibaculum piscium]